VAGGHATSVIQFQAGCLELNDRRSVSEAGGDESRLRRQRYVSKITAIVYLGPLTAVNNLATGLNWPTVAA